MNVQKTLAMMCVVGCTALTYGCGSDNPAPAPAPKVSGKLTQGPVSGATIFADNVSSGVRFQQDTGEISTTTDADGNFTLPSVPGYTYILVSQGGTDRLTNQPAIQMIAPAGSANVTPLTTLVALDTTGTVKAKIEALGTKFDADISASATPAALNLAKSVETVVAALTSTITQSAGTTATVSATQMAAVQAQAMQSISATLAAGTSDLSKPASLNTTMTTAVTAAVTSINEHNTNIDLPVAQAATIATNAVTASTTAILGASAVGSTTAANTSSAIAENTVINATTTATLVQSITTTAATVSATTETTTTPANYTPPVIPVSTPTTGSSGGSTVF